MTFDRVDTFFSDTLRKNGIKINYTTSSSYLSIRNLRTFTRVMSSDKYQVIHTHLTYAQLWVAVAFFLTGKRKKKLITTEHSVNNRRRKYKFLKLFDRFIYARYQTVTCISEATRTSIIKWLGLENKKSQSKYITIPNGVDITAYREARPLPKTGFGIRPDDTVVAMISSMGDAKDQDTLIRSMRSLPDTYKLLLVGDGARRSQLEMLADSIGVMEKVIFTGVRSDIPAIMATIDIYVQSSHWEGMPTVLLEAMAAGKVALASNVPGNAIIPERSLFDKGDAEALARMILSLTPTYREQLLAEQASIIPAYSVEKITDQILETYR